MRFADNDADHIVLTWQDDSIQAFTPEGEFLGAIACASGAGPTTRIDDEWHLIPVIASLNATNVGFVRIGPDALSITDVTDIDGAVHRPSGRPTMSRSGRFIAAFETNRDPMLLDLRSREMAVPAGISEFVVDRMEFGLGGAVVVASTDTGVWLLDPTGATEPRRIADRGHAEVTVAGTHAWFTSFGDDGLELVAHDLQTGERTATVPHNDFVRFQIVGENALLQSDSGLRMVTVDGRVGPLVAGPSLTLYGSKLASAYAFAHQTTVGEPEVSAIIAADGSLTPMPELDGLDIHADFWATDRLVFVDDQKGVVTMVNLADASVDTWQVRAGLPFHLVEFFDEGAAIALKLRLSDTTILFFEDVPTPLQLPGASQILVNVEAGLALLVETDYASVRSIPDGETLSRLEVDEALAIMTKPGG